MDLFHLHFDSFWIGTSTLACWNFCGNGIFRCSLSKQKSIRPHLVPCNNKFLAGHLRSLDPSMVFLVTEKLQNGFMEILGISKHKTMDPVRKPRPIPGQISPPTISMKRSQTLTDHSRHDNYNSNTSGYHPRIRVSYEYFYYTS